MRHHRSRLVQLATAVAASLAALAPTPAQGQSPPPGRQAAAGRQSPPTTAALRSDPDLPTAVVNSWALGPSGDKPGEPGTRPNLSYEVAAGDEVKDSVTLFNYSNVQLTFRLYATDAFNNVDGNFDLLPGDTPPVDAGTWVTLPQPNITVPAQTSATLPITVAVPPDATPGDHAAAILASSTAEGTAPDGKIVNVDRRTGSRLYIRVAGPLSPSLDIERVASTYRPSLNPLRGSVDVSYTVRNKGNVRLAAKQRLAVQAVFGTDLEATTPSDLPELLPGNAVTLSARFTGVPAPFLLSTKVVLRPFGARDAISPDAREVSRTSRSLAVPWSVVALLTVLGLGLYARRAYRRHQEDGLATGGALVR